MAKHRGGKQRSYKRKGRMSAKKAYREYVRTQLASGMSNDSRGNWVPRSGDLAARGLYSK